MSIRWFASVVVAIVAMVMVVRFIGRAGHGSSGPAPQVAPVVSLNATSFESDNIQSSPSAAMNFKASSVVAPDYAQVMRRLTEAEAQGRLPEVPAQAASDDELRAFGAHWQAEWGTSFAVNVEDGQPLLPAGSQAPPWAVTDLDGVPVDWQRFRGEYVLLLFGSLSCPTTCLTISEFESLARDYEKSGVKAIFIYQREAHPDSHFGYGVVPQAFTLKDRVRHARRMATMFSLTQRVTIDDLDNTTKRAYSAQDNSAFLIDGDGRVLLSQIFFNSSEIARTLAAALGTPGTDDIK